MFIDEIISEYKLIDVCIVKRFSGNFKLLESISVNNMLVNVN